MRQVGARRTREMTELASGEVLAESARFSEAISSLSNLAYQPKGVRRFSSHLEANLYDQECLARAMGALALRRRYG